MADHVYSVSEIVGTSQTSTDAAVVNALDRARRTLRNMDWFEVVGTRGHLADDGSLDHFQVTVKVGFRMED
ncbi:MAG: dodecin domain-containing protein [Solirubrobacterales bacterium]|nr:dodecin domain-containing protein [Solirubrobacterales bacterium]